MSKSIEDYRNIVKILKLQLLKTREQNKTLAHQLGLSSENETSSFTPRMEKYASNNRDFARHALLFTTFAHKCELVGISPEMIFRIADQKRDKKVSIAGLTEVMKRVRLRMDGVEISRLLNSITKSGSLYYDEYLQYLCAFQINSQKYPFKGQRTYTQLCLIKFASEARDKKISSDSLYEEVTNHENGPYLSFEDLTQFCRKCSLKEAEIIAIFMSMDIHSQCQISREVFKRQIKKIYSLVEKGISHEMEDDDRRPSMPEDRREHRNIFEKDEDDIKLEQETGVEAGNKMKKKPTKRTSDVKLAKGDEQKLIGQLKKEGISVNSLIEKLLKLQERRDLIRPFSLLNFQQGILSLSSRVNKKKIKIFFKFLDNNGNGSVSTEQLIKLWLAGKQISDPSQTLYKLLARHLRQIQYPEPILRFHTLGYEDEDLLTQRVINDAYENLNMEPEFIKQIVALIPNKTSVKEFCEYLSSGGIKKSIKVFKPMSKNKMDSMNVAIKKLLPKGAKSTKFPKYVRLDDDEGLSERQTWETIFTDEWSCWDHCLQVASKLDNYWRDPEFGPTTNDPHGYRSIVGNESEVPPGLPFEDQIIWLTFEEMLLKQNKPKEKVNFMEGNLSPNDVRQGKLGDCWLVSSLSIIAANDEYIKGKPEKASNSEQQLAYGIHPLLFHCFTQYGIYVFKFFKEFQPVYVMVDDLFPVEESSNELIFAHSPEDRAGVQWVAFLQKAYAKLHHCYSNLISGDISQGLNDLTNAVPIKEDLNSDDYGELLAKIQRLNGERQLMGCSISAPRGMGVQQPVQLDDERCGLFYGHAYSIGDMISFKASDKSKFDLIRVRNPWGHGEWMLDWSDKPEDPDYNKLAAYKTDLDKAYKEKRSLMERMGQEPVEPYEPGDDGDFLMNFEDFAKVYSNLFTGYSFDHKEYTCNYIREEWNKNYPSGICKAKGASEADRIGFVNKNHQYVMEIKEETDVLMMLSQQDGRLYRGEKYPYKEVCNGIIILVFTLEGERNLTKFDMDKMTLRRLKFELRREVDYWHRFKPGSYAIIPCKLKNKIEQSKFELRVYSEKNKPISLNKVKGPNNEFRRLQKPIKNVNPAALSSLLQSLK